MSGNLGVIAPAPEAVLTVTVVGGQMKKSAPVNPMGKYLVGVQPIRDHVVTTACRAGIYVRVMEVVNGGAARRDRKRVVWAGYYRDGEVPASVPNIRCNSKRQFIAEVAGIASFDTETIRVELSFDEAPAGGTDIHSEAPGSGPGQLVVVALGNPAAGAEYATQTVSALERWLPRGIAGTLVTSGVAGSRKPCVKYDDGANLYARSGATASLSTTGLTYHLAWGLGGANTNGNVTPQYMVLPVVYMASGHRMVFATDGLDAADDYGSGFALIEVWVMLDG